MRCRNMQRDIFHELAEILVPSHKIGLAIHLYEYADFALQVNIGSHDPLLRCTCGLLASGGNAFGPQNRLRFGQIAGAFDESALAIHKARIGFLAELLHQLWVDFSRCVHQEVK